METNINYTLVGAFIIVLIAATVFSIIWLSSGFSLAHYKTYTAYMRESVSGLNIDSTVEYNGVEVGSVKNIELSPENPRLVELTFDIKSDTPITEGTIATLTTRGLTGITYVALKDDGSNLKPLVAKKGEDYPVIKTGPSFLMRLDSALSQLSTNIKQVTESIQSVLNQENQESIRNILINMRSITEMLSENNKKFDVILENTARASAQFTPLLQSTMNAAKTLETQTLPSTYRLLNNLDNVTRTLTEVTEELKQNPSILVRGINRSASGPGERVNE